MYYDGKGQQLHGPLKDDNPNITIEPHSIDECENKMTPITSKYIEDAFDSLVTATKVDENAQTVGTRALPEVLKTNSVSTHAIPEVLMSGPYQYFFLVLMCMASSWLAFESVSSNFLSPRQDHWCYVPALGNLTAEQRREAAIPYDQQTGTYAQCIQYDVDWNNGTGQGQILQNRTRSCTEGYEYDQTTYGVTATSEFGLVCGDSWILELLGPLYMAGMAVGAFTSGFLSDTYGRKTTLLLSSALHFVGGLACVFSPNIWVYIAARVVLGMGVRSAQVSSHTLLMELMPEGRRTVTGVVYLSSYTFAVMAVLVPLAYHVRDFRVLELIFALGLVTRISYCWIVPESPRWLLCKGRKEAALREITRLSQLSCHPLPLDLLKEYSEQKLSEAVTAPAAVAAEQSEFRDLFRHPVIRRYTISLCIIFSTAVMIYYGMALNMGTMAGSVYINLLVAGAFDLSFNFGVTQVQKCIGRVRIIRTSAFIATVMLFATVPFLLFEGYAWIGTYVTLFGRAAFGAGAIMCWIYISELMPTSLRQRALGLAVSSGCVCSILAPTLGGTLAFLWTPLPTVAFGSLSLISFLVFTGMPETLGMELPVTVDDTIAIKTQGRNSVDPTKQMFGRHGNTPFTLEAANPVCGVAFRPIKDQDAPFYPYTL